MSRREVLLVVHTGRAENLDPACEVARRLLDAGLLLRVESEAAQDLGLAATTGVTVIEPGQRGADGAELVVALGGDGTLLRAAEHARDADVPLLGVNFGRVGFLAEAEPEDLDAAVTAVLDHSYRVEERLTLDVLVRANGDVVSEGWALNDVAVEKTARGRMLELVVEIDGRPLSRWGGDGVVFATPTGSTAYAFSAGGPVVWPEVEALLLVPISAHALFSRPLVTSPDSVLAVEVQEGADRGSLSCDGRRSIELPPKARVEVRRGDRPVRLARLAPRPFTDRLVEKFALPVQGWRGRRD